MASPKHHEPCSEQDSQDRRFRQLYKTPPDFRHLAKLDPAFSPFIKGRELDFNDPQAVKQLTKTLLKLDFNLSVDLPDDRLCPPVANRHSYILWLKDLLDTTSYEHVSVRNVVGMDIGTGASCIYPLLGCVQRPWSFIATDIDEKSLACARENVTRNHLNTRITVVPVIPEDKLIPLDKLPVQSLTFVMTNPPFYPSEEAMLKSAQEKARPPFTACTGSKGEMVTPGGEVGFVSRIFQESLVLRGRVQWYTAMLGFLSSLTAVVELLKQHQVDNYAVTEFVQGSKTRRWAVAWSFGPMRPAQHVARGTKLKGLQPAMTEYVVAKKEHGGASVGALADMLNAAVAGLELISWQWDREKLEGTGRAADKVWARAWRRRNKQLRTEQEMGECIFGFQVGIRVMLDHVSLECRWIEGHDESALESFRGFLKTTISPWLNQQ